MVVSNPMIQEPMAPILKEEAVPASLEGEDADYGGVIQEP